MRIVDLSAKSRLPTMYDVREFVEAGGLMTYGPSFPDLFRRATARGLRGGKITIAIPRRILVVRLATGELCNMYA